MSPAAARAPRRLRSEGGFTMIVAIGVMFVTGLLLVATFTAVLGDSHNSRESTIEKQAYYAALAGIQEYQFHLEKEPDYWEKCETPSSIVPGESETEHYEVAPLPANGKSACSTSKPFETMIESSGAAANTFRIESVGCAGVAKLSTCKGQSTPQVATRKIVATFSVTGFLQFVYFTRYEDEDPTLNETSRAACAKYYIEEKTPGHPESRSSECEVIKFVSGDKVEGPMFSDDYAIICGSPEFGRKERKEKGLPDKVELLGTHTECSGTPVFNTESGTYTKRARELIPPTGDESLLGYVEPTYDFSGATQITLNEPENEITVVNKGTTQKLPWPSNGLIYVATVKNSSCGYSFNGHEADGSVEKTEEANCGNAYVHGAYSKSLTVAAQNDLIVNGNIYPTSVTTLGSEPTGTATLGLIAGEFVRVYHPVQQTYAATETRNRWGRIEYECPSGGSRSGSECQFTNESERCNAENLSKTEDTTNGWGTLKNLYIYAAILSTNHSFTVDNYNCGRELEKLHVYGAIAQDFRGIVGTTGGTGYIKDYKYDQRLASDEPPYFLEPLNTGWEVDRETLEEGG